jgi:hypothetical protein
VLAPGGEPNVEPKFPEPTREAVAAKEWVRLSKEQVPRDRDGAFAPVIVPK